MPLYNSLGLILNMVGAGVVFFYGYPQPTYEEGVGIVLEENTKLPNGQTVKEHDVSIGRQIKKYICLSRIGFVLMFFGFVLQLLAIL